MKYLMFVLCLLCVSLPLTGNMTHKSASEILSGKLSYYDQRYRTFEAALNLMHERNVKVIVETGTTRGVNYSHIFLGDGGSTIIFAEWALQNDAILYSVDIEPKAFENAAPFLAHCQDSLITVCGDSVEFLENFEQTIDFLYLDSYDFDSYNPYPSQHHHLKEIIAAYPKLKEDSIILIDDCGLPHGGKGKLVIEYLKDRGWKIVAQGYQVLLTR